MATPSARKASSRAATQQGVTRTQSKSAKAGDAQASAASEADQTSLVDELKQQHREVEALLTQPEADQDLGVVVEQLATKWIPHTIVEEQIIVPALQKAGADEPALAEADVRRDLVKVLLADLREDPGGPAAAAKFIVLSSALEQLIEVEERADTGVLALAKIHDVDLDALKPEVDARKSDIEADTGGNSSEALAPTSLRLRRATGNRHEEEYSDMPNDSNTRDRDDNGRFTSDDNRRGGYRGNDRDRDENGRFTSDDDRGGYRSRSSRDYDDDYRRSGSNGGGAGRDDNGRFTSGGSSSRSSNYDDDRRGGRDDGRGWYGDPQGHSEASRRGWESREGAGYSSRSSRDYDDDNRRSGNDRDRDDDGRFTSGGGSSRSSRYEDDDRRSGQGRGWYGDSRGHAEAAREGWDERRGDGGGSRSSRDDDDRRGSGGSRHGGWFGDSRGHAEAAREGWDERRGNGGGSRSSRDDDDRRGSGGSRHGGWFGDSEGHSEASRRGWEDRR